MLIDTHAHIYSEDFDTDRSEMLTRAKEEGLEHIIMPSISRSEYPRMLSLLHEYQGFVSAALGLHPAYVGADYRDELNFVREHAHSEEWVAIGEIGLDYHWSSEFRHEQGIALREQLRLALELDLPVIFHVRDAFEDMFEVLREAEFADIRGVMHSFTGTEAELREVLSFPKLMVAINGVATFKNAQLRDYISLIPIDRLLIETDAPYLAPVPMRGKRNEPAFVSHTARYLASLWDMTYEDFARHTTDNARRLFALRYETRDTASTSLC